MMTYQLRRLLIAVVVGVLVIGLLAVSVWVAFSQVLSPTKVFLPSIVKQRRDVSSPTSWPTFTSTVAPYRFNYPSGWTVVPIPDQALPGRPDFSAYSPDVELDEYTTRLRNGMRLVVDVIDGIDATIPIDSVADLALLPPSLQGRAVGFRIVGSGEAGAKVNIGSKTLVFSCFAAGGADQSRSGEPCARLLGQILITLRY